MQLRNILVMLAVAFGVIALGCSRTVHIVVPDDFHGQARIICADAVVDHDSTLAIGASGLLENVSCPARQGHVQVSRHSGAPIDVAERWVTTGDGIVREITVNVQ